MLRPKSVRTVRSAIARGRVFLPFGARFFFCGPGFGFAVACPFVIGLGGRDVVLFFVSVAIAISSVPCYVEDSARREHKSVSEWIKERVQPQGDRARILAAMEARALANGYPPGWITLYGSLADDDSLVAPVRGGNRPVTGLELD